MMALGYGRVFQEGLDPCPPLDLGIGFISESFSVVVQ